MDVDRFNFWHTLPTAIEAISLSDYVAVDLKTTGVSGPTDDRASGGLATAAYNLAAEAAGTFQVVQFGLTCVSYDQKHNEYRTTTFTFHLTPELKPPSTALAKLIDRRVVLSCRSFLFLRKSNFSFDRAFSQGVTYLSRPEAALAGSLYLNKCGSDTAAYTRSLDTWSRKFLNDSRSDIVAWLETDPESGDSVLITSPDGPSHQLLEKHVRIIRRLVRAEFPGCFVVVEKLDHFARVIKWNQQERQLWDAKYRRRHEAVVRQTGKELFTLVLSRLLSRQLTIATGFRYIVEALVGGSFARDIDPELLAATAGDDDPCVSRSTVTTQKDQAARLRADLLRCEARLKQRRPILVSHNPLLDVCFILETFLQLLPSAATTTAPATTSPSSSCHLASNNTISLEPFRAALTSHFPRVIDTKYLASQLGFRSSRNLAQLYELVCGGGGKPGTGALPRLLLPRVVPEPGFEPDQGGGTGGHNAGFGSWMTAVVFVSLARKIALRNPGLCRGVSGGGGKEGGVEGSRTTGSGSGKGLDEEEELLSESSPYAAPGGSGRGGKAGVRLAAMEQIPPWDREIWRRYGNKLRLGDAAMLDLDQS